MAILEALPRNLHLDKFWNKATRKNSSTSSKNVNGDFTSIKHKLTSPTIKEEEKGVDNNGKDKCENEEAQTKDAGLVNA